MVKQVVKIKGKTIRREIKGILINFIIKRRINHQKTQKINKKFND